MGQQYKVECEFEADTEEIWKLFFDWLEKDAKTLSIAEIDRKKGTFIFYHYRGVDYGHIHNKLNELHKLYPEEQIIFNAYVTTEVEELGYAYDSDYEEEVSEYQVQL
jgi:hypothetical protein